MSDAERPTHSRADRCIVWRPRGTPPDRELLDALARRSLVITHCQDPFGAVGALCGERTVSGALVLLIVDPAKLARVSEVVNAARRYSPRAVFWEFDSTSRRLRAFVPADTAATSAAAPRAVREVSAHPRAEPKVSIARPAPLSAPHLKLAGEGPLPPACEEAEALSAGKDAPQPVRQVLTDEELAMLLSPGPIRGNG